MNHSRLLNFSFRRKLPIWLQTEAAECALACLGMLLSYHGHQTTLSEMRQQFPISLKGATLSEMIDTSDKLGLISRPLRLELEEIEQLKLPAILHWDLNHFVVLKAVKRGVCYIHDPAAGEIAITLRDAGIHFTGIALELAPGLPFRRKPAPPPIKLRTLVGKVVGLKLGLLQLLGLAVVLEVFSLALPVFTQWITDEAIVGGDKDFLALLVLGMFFIGVASTIIGAVRSWIAVYISTHFNLQWLSNIMSRLLKLPVDYFERRHLGDIVSRFGAVKAIETSLTSASIEALLDGILACGTLTMMFIYSPVLSSVTIAAASTYTALRWIQFGAERIAATGAIAKQAKEQSYFLETIRGVRSIKLLNRENERRAAWLNLWVDATNAGLIQQKLNLLFTSGWSLILAFERAVVFWLGANAVIDHRLSLGMLFAFLGFKEQFSGRINRLIDRCVEYSMLSVSTERLADIVLSRPEENLNGPQRDLPSDLTLTVKGLSFRYSESDAFLLNGADLIVREGECVAIVGPSGCGKSSFLKLLLGISKPSGGRIELGNVPIARLGLRSFRNIIGSVMQDDCLFAGSVFENICFLDPKPDRAWVAECARMACVEEEIMQMPMGFQTLVGDMGAAISGGQKQRILLARALYRRPKILLLDEATSHLDTDNEARIGKIIAGLQMTRIMIAHRPQTIEIADRVLRLEKGKLIDIMRHCKGDVQRSDMQGAEEQIPQVAVATLK